MEGGCLVDAQGEEVVEGSDRRAEGSAASLADDRRLTRASTRSTTSSASQRWVVNFPPRDRDEAVGVEEDLVLSRDLGLGGSAGATSHERPKAAKALTTSSSPTFAAGNASLVASKRYDTSGPSGATWSDPPGNRCPSCRPMSGRPRSTKTSRPSRLGSGQGLTIADLRPRGGKCGRLSSDGLWDRSGLRRESRRMPVAFTMTLLGDRRRRRRSDQCPDTTTALPSRMSSVTPRNWPPRPRASRILNDGEDEPCVIRPRIEVQASPCQVSPPSPGSHSMAPADGARPDVGACVWTAVVEEESEAQVRARGLRPSS